MRASLPKVFAGLVLVLIGVRVVFIGLPYHHPTMLYRRASATLPTHDTLFSQSSSLSSNMTRKFSPSSSSPNADVISAEDFTILISDALTLAGVTSLVETEDTPSLVYAKKRRKEEEGQVIGSQFWKKLLQDAVDHMHLPRISLDTISRDSQLWHLGRAGETCARVCKRAGRECSTSLMRRISSCDILGKAFEGYKCDDRFWGSDQPAVDLDKQKILVTDLNSHPKSAPLCDSRPRFSTQRRICACVDANAHSTEAVTSRMFPYVMRRLEEHADAEERHIAWVERKRKNDTDMNKSDIQTTTPAYMRYFNNIGHEVDPERVFENHMQTSFSYPDPKILFRYRVSAHIMAKQLVAGNISFVTTRPSQSCYDACRSIGRFCDRDWFDPLNHCEVMKKAFPEATRCEHEEYFGSRYMPLIGRLGEIQLNSAPYARPSTCGVSRSDSRRVCGCVRDDEAASIASMVEDETRSVNSNIRDGSNRGGLHVIYNAQSSKYMNWQSRFSHYWFQKIGMRANYTRLLTANKDDGLQIPTIVAPYHPKSMLYSPYNKPASIAYWIENHDIVEKAIMIIDPDCAFVAPFHVVPRRGHPIAQQSFFNFDRFLYPGATVPLEMANRYCKTCAFFDPVAVPVIMHIDDLRQLAPLWMAKIDEIEADRPNWGQKWNDAASSPVTIGWTMEMFAYVFAAAELGFSHDIWEMQDVPPVNKVSTRPLIHYHVHFDLPDKKAWFKGYDTVLDDSPWPVPEGMTELETIFLGMIHDAKENAAPDTIDYSKFAYRQAIV